MVRHPVLAAATSLAIVLLPSGAVAQSLVLPVQPRTTAWAELTYPSFDADGISALLLNAGARIRIGRGTALVVEVPVIWSSEDSPVPDDGLMLGNPYVGVQQILVGPSTTYMVHLGYRKAVVGSDAPGTSAAAGLFGDFDRAEAYVPEASMLEGGFELIAHPPGGVRLAFGAGPSGWFTEYGDDELFLNYRAGAGVEAANVQVMAWFTGRWNVTSDGGDFGSNTIHQLTVLGALTGGRVRPTAFVRVPLDKDLDLLNLAIGAGFAVGL
jgi:hypothetical protein